MCTCTTDSLCPAMVQLFSALHEVWEGTNLQPSTQTLVDMRKAFVAHRTAALLATKELAPGGTTGFQFFKDWRERLDPAYQPKD